MRKRDAEKTSLWKRKCKFATMFNNETLKQTPAKPILKHGLHQYVYFGPREEENLLNDSGQGIEPPAAHRVRLVHPTIFGAARRSRSGLGTGGGGLTLSPGTFGGGFARISRESLLSRSASGTEVHHYYQNNDRVRFLGTVRLQLRFMTPPCIDIKRNKLIFIYI